jgi:DNA invertase Pin-like site-specific DNA recombinase
MSLIQNTIAPRYALYIRELADLPAKITDANAARLEEFVALVGKENVTMFDDVFERDDLATRPALQYMLNDVRNGRLDAVVVSCLQSLCRRLSDFKMLYSILQENDVVLIVVGQEDIRNHHELFEMQKLVIVDEFERKCAGRNRSGLHDDREQIDAARNACARQVAAITLEYEQAINDMEMMAEEYRTARMKRAANDNYPQSANDSLSRYQSELEDLRADNDWLMEKMAA